MSTTDGIDVVVTWVDGLDPAHLAKLERYSGDAGIRLSGQAVRARYADAGELLYCLRSIFAYMGWVRKIFLVTDAQRPRYFDHSKLAEHNIFIVDHAEIFKEYAAFLPVFSSTAIESMIWRIDGLSEHFILFNDDCFLGKGVRPEDFYRDGRLQLRGEWAADEPAAGLPGWKVRQARASRLAGVPEGRFYLSHHAPFALRRSMMAEAWDCFRDELMGNIARRFRDRDMVNLVSLCHARALVSGTAAIVDTRDRVQYSGLRDDATAEEIDALVDAIERNYAGGVKFCCINDLSWLLSRSDRLRPILRRRSGPPLPFEVTGALRRAPAQARGHADTPGTRPSPAT